VNTLQIPPSSGRRSRSASRSRGGPDEGYVIKSLKSTGDDEPSGRVSSTRLASGVSDGKVGFDVELTQHQRQLQRQQWEVEQSSSQQVLSLSSQKHRSLLIESVTPSSRPTSSRQMLDPENTAPPAYTMTMNQQMTMNYEPPLPSPKHPQQDVLEETVRRRTTHMASSGSAAHEAMIVDDRYSAGAQPSSSAVRPKKKKKRPHLVSSGTQMSFDKSTQSPKLRENSDDEPTQRSKTPVTKSARKTPEPEMVSRATQMAVNKSTQVKKPKNDDEDDDGATTTSSDEEPHHARKTRRPQKHPLEADEPRKKLTNVGVQVTTKNAPDDERYTPSGFDSRQPRMDQGRGPAAVNGYQKDNPPRTGDRNTRSQRRQKTDENFEKSVVDEWRRKQPVARTRDESPTNSDDQIQPQRRNQSLKPLPEDWVDRNPESDLENGDASPGRQSADSRGGSPYGKDAVDVGPDGRGSPDDEDVVDDDITARKRRDPRSGRDWRDNPSDSDDDPRKNRRVNAEPSYPNDDVDGTQRPDQYSDYRTGVDTTDSWESRTAGGQRSNLHFRNVGDSRAASDAERVLSVPVTSSVNFDKQDEDYLRRRRMNNASARQSLHSRSGGAGTCRRPVRHEEAKGFTQFALRFRLLQRPCVLRI